MGLQMLFLVGHLIKCCFTAKNWTAVGSLTCVDPQVVKQIVPFLENPFASFEIALEITLRPAGSMFYELYNCEFFRAGNVAGNFE